MEAVFEKYCQQYTYDKETYVYEGYIAGEPSYNSFIDELKGLGVAFAVRDSKENQNVKGT